MAIYPKNKHLKLNMISSSLLGCFPWQFMYQDDKYLQKIYNIYSKFIFAYFLLYELRIIINLFEISIGGDINMDEISSNMCVNLICFVTICRQLLMKLNTEGKNMIKFIIDKEDNMVAMDDEEIYPKCKHFWLCMISCSLVGSFPWQFMFQDNKCLQQIYKIYSKLLLAYYVSYFLRICMNLYVILSGDSVRMDDVSSNMCVNLINVITISRQMLLKLNPSFIKVIKFIIDKEKSIVSTDDADLNTIYDECAKNTNQKTKFYQFILVALTIEFIIGPLVSGPIHKQVGNETVVIKPMPLPTWFPFDEQAHYLPAYIWQIFDGIIAAAFVTFTDTFMSALIAFPIGQLKMLQHRLRNFETYKQQYKALNNLNDDDLAGFRTFKDLIEDHKEIIDYIETFNKAMSSTSVFDFLQSSLQIAFIVSQMSEQKLTLMLIFVVATFFASMVLRLILYYYYANEIIYLSEELARAAWESNWYEQSKQIKFMVFMFIMRSQKSLKFSIGSFGAMSLNSFIAILKATYSYITLMYGVH